jgi:hypothetical protein
MHGKSRLLALTSAALLVACVGPTIAAAEVRLSGNADQLVLEANNATMSEIIAGIQSTLHTRVVLYGSINRQFNGTYAGPLRRVLAHLLDGADYVMSPDRDQIRIVLLGADVSRGTFRVAQGGSPGQPAASPSAAADELSDSRVQGWTGVPSELPPRVPPSVNAIAAAAALLDSDVQGWTGVPSELPPRVPPSVNAIAAAAALPDSDVQGWTGVPSELPPRVPPSVNAIAAAAALPDSDVQGWTGVPSELPARAQRP